MTTADGVWRYAYDSMGNQLSAEHRPADDADDEQA